MAVYVDDAAIPAAVRDGDRVHGSRWSHLFADSQEELHAFAARLGLRPDWFQPGKPRGDGSPSPFWHYDLTAGKRLRAIQLGAQPVAWRDSPQIIRAREARHRAPAADQPLLFTSSRDGVTEADVEAALRPLFAPGRVLVSGGARGGDRIAERLWREWGGQVDSHPVSPKAWQRSRGAGYARNAEMVAEVKARGGECVAVIARCTKAECPRTEPHGTHGAVHCAGLAEDEGLRVIRVKAAAEPEDGTGAAERAVRQAGLAAPRPMTLAEQTAGRLAEAGIGGEDPGLRRAVEHNAALGILPRAGLGRGCARPEPAADDPGPGPRPLNLAEAELDKPGCRPAQHWRPATGRDVAMDPAGRNRPGPCKGDGGRSMTTHEEQREARMGEARQFATARGLSRRAGESLAAAVALEPGLNLGVLDRFPTTELRESAAAIMPRVAYGPDHERGAREYLGTAARMASLGRDREAAHWLAEAGREITIADDRRVARAAVREQQVTEQMERDEANRATAEREELAARATAGKDPQAAGAEAADRVIRAQAAAGVSTERISAHSQDTAAWLFSEAREPDGEAFARGYDDAAQAMVAELQEEARPAPDRSPGAPHPDPWLAARGWQACEHGDGVYVRRAAAGQRNAGMEREAG